MVLSVWLTDNSVSKSKFYQNMVQAFGLVLNYQTISHFFIA